MSEYLYLVTPLGRLTRGSLVERAKEDYDGNPYEDGKGPFEIALAIRKDDPNTATFLGQLYQKAVTDAPSLKPKIDAEWQSGFTIGAFRFKIRDGDKPLTKGDRAGQVNPNNAGCYVLNMSTQLPMKFTYTDQYGLSLIDVMGQPIPSRTEISPDKIKIGDYVHAAISVKYNSKTDHTAGIYLSQSAIMLAGYGEAISGGLSLTDAFAAVPMGALPAGASVGGKPNPLPGAAPVAALPVQGGAPTLPTASPMPNVQPHTAFLQAAPVGLPLPGQ